MAQKSSDITFRRILVALDTSPHSRAALKAAAHLAKISEGELEGLFVSDATWHRIGRLSLITEVSEITGEQRQLGKKDIEKQCRLLENRIRRHLTSIARDMDIAHSMRSVKGSIAEELLKAAEDADLVTIGRTGHAHKQESELGKTARVIIQQSPKPVLMVEKGLSIGNNPIICVYDGTKQSQRGLKVALQLAERNKNQLIIIGLANQSDSVQDRNKEIEQEVQNAKVPVRLHLLKQHNIWNVTRLLNKLNGSLLIMPKDQPLIKEEWAGKIFNMAKCPLLLMS